jgi:Fe-S cluster assembly protein SufD
MGPMKATMTPPMTSALNKTGVDRFSRAFVATQADLPGESSYVPKLRQQAHECFQTLGFPTLQMEEWRFTNVGPIAKTDFDLAATPSRVQLDDLERFDVEGASRLVLVNGRFDAALSEIDDLPDGLIVSSTADALKRHPEIVEKALGRYAHIDHHAFVALNTALWRDGAFIYVPPKLVVERPINLISLAQTTLSTPDEGPDHLKPIAFFPRNLLIASESSQSTVIEQYGTIGEGRYLCSPVTEVVVADNAVVDHYKLQRESTAAFHMATFQIQQARDSNFSSHSISWGGGIVRNDVNAVLGGEGCVSTLNGLYMVEGDQLVDNHMRVDHAKPHCDSHELFKGILEGNSRAVFNGRIFVHKGAQKTDAKQTNRNLLLSEGALCNSNPQLEIFADDVKCTHGSTVGQLDDTAIFYLRSRGIGEEAARSLLTYAFAADIVSRIKVPVVKQNLEEFLFRRLPKGEVVRQAV